MGLSLPLTSHVIVSSLGSHFSLSLYFFTNKGAGPKNFPHFSQFKDLAKAVTLAHSKPLSLGALLVVPGSIMDHEEAEG